MSEPDPLRGQIAAVLAKHRIHDTSPGEVTCWACLPDGWMDAGTYFRHVADTVLPILRAAEKQARAETAEQIAQAIERERGQRWQKREQLADGKSKPYDYGMNVTYHRAVYIARQHGSAP